jgi:hypothetical protein
MLSHRRSKVALVAPALDEVVDGDLGVLNQVVHRLTPQGFFRPGLQKCFLASSGVGFDLPHIFENSFPAASAVATSGD